MQIIERIAGMDQVQLARLQANAERILQRDDERRHGEARTILAAVAQEQARRTDEERERENAAKAVIKVRVRDMALFDRVVTAFSDLPAKDWKAEVLNAVARNPRGQDCARDRQADCGLYEPGHGEPLLSTGALSR